MRTKDRGGDKRDELAKDSAPRWPMTDDGEIQGYAGNGKDHMGQCVYRIRTKLRTVLF